MMEAIHVAIYSLAVIYYDVVTVRPLVEIESAHVNIEARAGETAILRLAVIESDISYYA
jgi:hypothetical protein